MTIREIEMTQATPTACAVAHIEIDGVEYMIIGSRHSVTVLCGDWIYRGRWARGKTFFSAADLAKHYKRHGSELVPYANRITNWGN